MSDEISNEFPLFRYIRLVDHLCRAIHSLAGPYDGAPEDYWERAIEEYVSQSQGSRYDEFVKWVCRNSWEIQRLRVVPFHCRISPYLDWSPAVYALTCICGEIIDSVISLDRKGKMDLQLELPSELAKIDPPALSTECIHELYLLDKHLVAKQKEAKRAPSDDEHLRRIVELVGDEHAGMILDIARRSGPIWTGEKRMEAILRLDNRFVGKDSNWWSAVLGVSPNAVRSYSLWKRLRGQTDRA